MNVHNLGGLLPIEATASGSLFVKTQIEFVGLTKPTFIVVEMAPVHQKRKMGDIAKGKAPGYSGNTPDLYAPLPTRWHEWALKLANVTQHTGVTPNGWHIDLVCYIHKGGDDGSLSNHRHLCLIEVLRKVATSIATDRMRRDWNRMHLLDDANPGFQAGRTTANSVLPLRLAAELCVATKQHFAALLGDLKWRFDTPARTVVELALMRLGVPSYYYEMLEDIDLHSAKTTVTAAGLARGAGSSCCCGLHPSFSGGQSQDMLCTW